MLLAHAGHTKNPIETSSAAGGPTGNMHTRYEPE